MTSSQTLRRFVLCGATSDLATRYLVPAIARLHAGGHLPDGFQLIGVARRAWDAARFRQHLRERAQPETAGTDAAAIAALAECVDYRQADVAVRGELTRVLREVDEPMVVYLALPPALFYPVLDELVAAGLPPGSRIVVEKPFGEDLESARALNRLVHRCAPEDSIFRLDHFLGMQTVQNLLALRFANRIVEPIWNARHVARVEITWDETVTAAGRAGFYDRTGALRDMIQNHLMQVFALVAMEPVASIDARELRDRKVDLLRAVQPPDVRLTRRARYGASTIGGRHVPAYVDEQDVDPSRGTETFAAVTLSVENPRWAGVPFVLRTGKALGRDRHDVAVHFQPATRVIFGDRPPAPNVLRLQLDPDHVSLSLNAKASGDLAAIETIALDAPLGSTDLPAYAWLVRAVLRGDPTLSIRHDEVEEAWRIVDPVVEAWRAGDVPLEEYPAGSNGPGEERTP